MYNVGCVMLAAQQLAVNRLRRAPAAAAARQRTMLVSGFYRPRLFAQRRQGYEPETAMSAFATGENVAAGSFLGSKLGPCANCAEQDPEQQDTPLEQGQFDELPAQQPEQIPLSDAVDPAEPADAVEPADEPISDYVGEAELAPIKPARTPKQKPSKKVQKQESEESDVADEEEAAQVTGRRPYASYFPIVFSGYPGGAARSGASGGGHGGVTAIANSYSTGKGGVATSHATAYGSGAAPKSRKRVVPADDDEE